MIELVIAALWFAMVTLLLTRAFFQYRHYEVLSPKFMSTQDAPSVTVIIPARNEARNIFQCVSSLREQNYPEEKRNIIVVDDNSEDETSALASKAARSDSRIKLIQGSKLPSGWMGKPFACWQGAQLAESDWLCFIDADTTASPALLATAISTAQIRNLDMLSLEPFQVLGSFWERLIIPAGFVLLAFQQDVRKTNDPDNPEAVANGQFILIRRDVYRKLGGHASVRTQVTEDTALAQAVKNTGGRLALLGAEQLIQTRMYTGLKSLWEGFSKNLTETVGGIIPALLVGLSALIMAGAALVIPMWTGVRAFEALKPILAVAFGLGMFGSAALFATHISATRYFIIPFGYGFLFPLGYIMGTALAINSVLAHLRRRITWKGRTYESAFEPRENKAAHNRASTLSRREKTS